MIQLLTWDGKSWVETNLSLLPKDIPIIIKITERKPSDERRNNSQI